MLTDLQKRCVDILYTRRMTHVSSVLYTVGVIDQIYDLKKPHEAFVLGNAHASLALFVVLEKHGLCDATEMAEQYGTHTCRDMERGVWVSGGSLGQAETVAVGLAMGAPDEMTYLVTSDGACLEGCVWESLRIAETLVNNLSIHIVFNGFGAYSKISRREVEASVGRYVTVHDVRGTLPGFLSRLDGHYLTLTEPQYKELTA